MKRCKYCGENITWEQHGRTSIPRNLDGVDHRESCIGLDRRGRPLTSEQRHEARVSAFLAQQKRVKR